MAHQVSRNVRFLLWLRELPPAQWPTWLSGRTSLKDATIEGLVEGDIEDSDVLKDEVDELARAFELDAEGILYADLPHEQRNVLLENLRYLFRSLERGGKQSLAREMGIDPTTVSRWLSGANPPQAPSLNQLVSYFGLPAGTDLKEEPVFLSAEPVAILERRKLIRDRVDALSVTEFRQLYPALKRLLEER